jgi:hypothetical protein
MIATKVLKTHMTGDANHIIDEMVENMTSKLYFHGHPINRAEAKKDLKLKVLDNPSPSLEKLMWDLYLDFEDEMKNLDSFNPLGSLYVQAGAAPTQGTAVHSEFELIHAIVQSTKLKSTFKTKRRYVMSVTPQGPNVQEHLLEQGWNHLTE